MPLHETEWNKEYDLYKETKAKVKDLKKTALDKLQEKTIYNDAALKKAGKDLLKSVENSLLHPENLADFLVGLGAAGAAVHHLWTQFDGFIKCKKTLGWWGGNGLFYWGDPDKINRGLDPSIASAFDRHGASGELKIDVGYNGDLGANDGARPSPYGLHDEGDYYIMIGIEISW